MRAYLALKRTFLRHIIGGRARNCVRPSGYTQQLPAPYLPRELSHCRLPNAGFGLSNRRYMLAVAR